MRSKGNTPLLVVGMQACKASVEISMVILRKLGLNLPQDPAIPLLGVYLKDAQSYHKDICSPMFIAALFIIARTWKQLKCLSTKEWKKKIWYVYTMEDNSVFKNKRHLEICMKMDGTRKNTS